MRLVGPGAPIYLLPRVSVLRTVLLALLASLLFGLAVGTWLRLRLERPTWYIGALGVGPEGLVHAALRILIFGEIIPSAR